MADIRSDVRRLILDLKNPDKWDYTGYVTLDVVDGKRWAIVIGWMDGFDDEGTADYKRDDCRLCGKVAYQSTHSVMQEYDYDWLMPYDESTGEVWDTDTSIGSDSNIDSCIDWWLSEWEEIKKIYVYTEEDYDEDIESSTDIQSSKMYELSPTDGRKSFYGKAKVLIDDDGSETLYSYGTPIIRRNANGDLDPLWDGYSATTGRHLKSFAGLDKKGYMDLIKKKGVQSSTSIECISAYDEGSVAGKYADKAKRLVIAIMELAASDYALGNLEGYVARHGDEWISKYVKDVDGLVSELEQFASMN